jgi:hypothetical protein
MDANTKIAVDREQRGHRSAGKWRNADLPPLRDLRSPLQAWPLGLGRGDRQQQEGLASIGCGSSDSSRALDQRSLASVRTRTGKMRLACQAAWF